MTRRKKKAGTFLGLITLELCVGIAFTILFLGAKSHRDAQTIERATPIPTPPIEMPRTYQLYEKSPLEKLLATTSAIPTNELTARPNQTRR